MVFARTVGILARKKYSSLEFFSTGDPFIGTKNRIESF
jgi:hypothetical protein